MSTFGATPFGIGCQEYPELRDGESGAGVAYLSPQQNARLERIRRGRLLWRGQHRRYFLDEGRTQFNFERMRAQGQIVIPYLSVNLLKLISTTFADLLLGKDPRLSVADPAQQAMVDALAMRSDLSSVVYDAVVAASWAREAMVEVVRMDGEVYVVNRKSDEMFPVGRRGADGQYQSYVRYATETVGKRTILLETTYAAGSITRAAWWLNDASQRQDAPAAGTKGEPASLADWPVTQSNGEPLAAQEATGIDVPTIVWLGNEPDEGEPTSDYSVDLQTQQDHLNAAETQLSVVLAKHASPKMYLSRKQVNPATGGIETSAGVFFIDSKDDIPGYVTWNAELASALENRNQRLLTMAMISETTPALLGIRIGAAPESADKFRLDATKPVARAARKAKRVGPFIRTILDTARALQASTSYAAIEAAPSAVTFRDALPVDIDIQASAIATLRSAKSMSIERSVELQIEDPTAAAAEVARIKDETAAEVPGIFGRPGVGGGQPAVGGGGDGGDGGDGQDTGDTGDTGVGAAGADAMVEATGGQPGSSAV